MLINLKVKTLDARIHEFSIDNELTIRQFKDQIAEKTNIAAENQRIIYQGRVLVDDKQVKEYDVDGKVLHVAERPPFSQRGANARNNDEPMRTFRNVARPQPPGMRNSPYFRAIDGMLVSTMAIPVNNGPVAGARPPPNRYPNSSSFCINRITVALHMIDCADNIAAYLENPAIGLNNQSLDILQRGRWSMESTVVEVGVSSSDLPRNNNIIDMVQDAVTAALSHTGARNYTVVQLPTVYTNENGETSQQGTAEAGTSEGAASGAASNASGETTAATVIIEDVIETDDEVADGASDRSVTPTPEPEAEGAVGGQLVTAAETPTSSAGSANDAAAEGGNNSGPRRRTRPQVLAQVIHHYRAVQTRLAPFVDRYYEILQNDPTFEESDTDGRENAQRIFDRVSEAFHYLSHAQHAISDLMLDLSQPGPRVLTCRPILVEQSGYIRSNNIFTPNFLAQPSGIINEPFRNRAPGSASAAGTQTATTAGTQTATTAGTQTATTAGTQTATTAGTPTAVPPAQAANLQAATDASRSAAAMAEIASRAAGAAAEMAAGAASAAAGAANAAAAAARDLSSDPVEDPVDEPMVAPNAAGAATPAQEQQRLEMDHDHDDQSDTPERETRPVPRLRVYVPVTLPPPNPQLEMARIIQAMVNGQRPNDVHVEFNAPNVMSINLPVHVMTTVRQAPAAGSNETAEQSASDSSSPESAPASGNGESPNAASTSSGTRSGDQRANTLPTTATQTRSTSRPQIQIGGNNNWGGRIAPTHTAFDRFLPCNSHHIREPEQLLQNNSTSRSTSTAPAGGATVLPPTSAAVTRPVTTGRIQRGSNTIRPMWSSRRQRPASEQLSSLGPAAWAQAQTQTTHIPSAHVGAGSTNGAGVGAGRVRPVGGSTINRDRLATRTAHVGGGSTNGGLNSGRRGRLQAATSRLSRHLPTQLANFLINNMRNNAPTASVGSAVAAVGDTAASPSGEAVPIASTTPAAPPQTVLPTSTLTPGGDSNNLRSQLRSFLNDSLFVGVPINEQTIPGAIGRALDWFGESLVYLPQYERPEYNSRDSVCNILRVSLRLIIELCNGAPAGVDSAQFEQSLKQICDQFRKRLYSVLFLCLGSANAELYWRQLMRLLCAPMRSNFRNEALQFLCIYIDPTIPAQADTVDAQQFLVLRSIQGAPPTAADEPFVSPPPFAFNPQQQQPQEQSLDTDVEMAEVAPSGSNSSPAAELPAVIVGSEPWHMSFPNDWLPVITRDLQTQSEQSNRPQQPFSDAYISGMSAKRRKIIQSEKPTASVECLLANGVQRAIQSVGLGGSNGGSASSSSISMDTVIGSIAHDPTIQAAYTDAVRNSLKERIQRDVDFKTSKYPQIAKFTEQK
ncbi:large proline-rich protein BAG6 isoform X2 [Drosophila sechellia]|uniref:large proline-rich protein BAG6 isoform X2 n=1 Tax=Drosophila sechellia TaxID=7238 RepID=UPI0013DE210F|nr:large proline-rich protein BAG6 isoform X2 [Drosophila sechellia]